MCTSYNLRQIDIHHKYAILHYIGHAIADNKHINYFQTCLDYTKSIHKRLNKWHIGKNTEHQSRKKNQVMIENSFISAKIQLIPSIEGQSREIIHEKFKFKICLGLFVYKLICFICMYAQKT